MKCVWGIVLLLGAIELGACSRDNSKDLLAQVEALEAAESADLFAKAKQAADNDDVEEARKLIKQALGRGAGSSGLAEAETAIQQARNRKAVSSFRRAGRSSGSSRSNSRATSTSQCKDYVNFSFDGPGWENYPTVSMSGPSGTYQYSNSGNSVSFAGGVRGGKIFIQLHK